MYNVLWFDDEHQEREDIKESAHLNDIRLFPFCSAEEGLNELERNLGRYDAVLVDGIFYRASDSSSVSDRAFDAVAKRLSELTLRRALPWFVLSGQPSFARDSPFLLVHKEGKVYDKADPQQLNRLWIDMKAAISEQPEAQIRHEFSRVFAVCTERYVGEQAQRPLLTILKSLKTPSAPIDDEAYFTQLRIVLEWMFRAAHRLGLLHERCINDKGIVNLTESALFLSGEPTRYLGVKCAKSHFPKFIANMVERILLITGAASHTVDPQIEHNINLKEYRAIVRSPYLLYSLTFQVADILLWFKEYADANGDVELNRSLWQEIPWIPGEIVSISLNGFAKFQPTDGRPTLTIPPEKVKAHKLQASQRVEVTTKPSPDGTKTWIDSVRT